MGDNVGDVAGMGADLFGSFAESTCAALVIGGNSITNNHELFDFKNYLFILLIPAVGIIVCIIVTAILTEGEGIEKSEEVELSLKKQLIYSTILLLPLLYITSRWFMGDFMIFFS